MQDFLFASPASWLCVLLQQMRWQGICGRNLQEIHRIIWHYKLIIVQSFSYADNNLFRYIHQFICRNLFIYVLEYLDQFPIRAPPPPPPLPSVDSFGLWRDGLRIVAFRSAQQHILLTIMVCNARSHTNLVVAGWVDPFVRFIGKQTVKLESWGTNRGNNNFKLKIYFMIRMMVNKIRKVEMNNI